MAPYTQATAGDRATPPSGDLAPGKSAAQFPLIVHGAQSCSAVVPDGQLSLSGN